MSEPRTLYVSTFAPVLGSGRAMRTYTCVRALATLGPVDLAYVDYGGAGPSPEYRAIENLTFHEIRSSRGLARAALYASKRLQGVPPISCRGTSPELVAVARRLADEPLRGRVVAGDMAAATALMSTARERPFIYNAHNVESEYVHRNVLFRPLSHATMRGFERRLLTLAAESWMVSRTDIASAQELAPRARLRYAPNVVDVSAIASLAATRREPGVADPRLMMVGDFTYLPNRSGLDFMVEAVLPLVWESEPGVRLMVVGRGLEQWLAPDPRVQVAGFVDDLTPHYAQAQCVVVPLTEGAGTPLKFVEALAYGVPIVATPLAAKGLQVKPEVHYRSGTDARTFAAGVIANLHDGGAQLAVEGRLLAEREYSVEALAEAIST
jgi:glycosyltransferase involved in cell wall biosynthesis